MPGKELADYIASARTVTVNNKNIAYWCQGKGPDVWFLHGFPSASWDWHHQWQDISKTHRCHAIDFLGFGLSDKPASHRYSLLEQADILASVMQQVGVSTAVIIAHDYGVSVAQELLHRAQRQALDATLSQIVFLNGGLFADVHRPLFTQTLLKGPLGPVFVRLMNKRALRRSFLKIFGPDTPPTDEVIDSLWALLCVNNGRRVLPSLLGYLAERVIHQQAWEQAMKTTEVPLTFINGVLDPISGGHMLEAFSQRVPQGECISLMAGHYPQLEMPDDVTQHIKQKLI